MVPRAQAHRAEVKNKFAKDSTGESVPLVCHANMTIGVRFLSVVNLGTECTFAGFAYSKRTRPLPMEGMATVIIIATTVETKNDRTNLAKCTFLCI